MAWVWHSSKRLRSGAVGLILALTAEPHTHASDDLEFFEKRIRPLLIEHCQECHGAKKQQGGLRLDGPTGWNRGGDSGPAWTAGDPDHSRLIQAVRRTDPEFQMPPKHALSADQVAGLEEWIRRGAPAPADTAAPSDSPLSRTNHWAYQPVAVVQPPTVTATDWPQTPVDAFVWSRLNAAGRQPAPDAEPRVLIRRLYFDLIGLPPSPEDVDAFVAAVAVNRTAAIAECVERLLTSPRFGERWARHWFDVVRYAESVTLRGFIFPEAWRYRDYVIQAFNSDLPYDQFVREQIAGDLLTEGSLEERQRRLVATTFLALGNTNLEEQDKRQLELDVIDEQLDVLGKALLGQALGCARCHDHKFDPIPTRDYYALAGIFASTRLMEHANVSKWLERPLPLPAAEEADVQAREAEGARWSAQIEALKAELKSLESSNSVVAKTVTLRDLPGIVVDDTAATAVGEWKVSTHTQPFVESGYRHDDNSGKGAKTLTFHPEIPVSGTYEVRFAYTPGDNRSTAVPVTVFSADGEVTIPVNQQVPPPVEGRFVTLGRYRFEASGAGFVLVSNEGTTGHVIADAVQFLPTDRSIPIAVAATSPSTNRTAASSRLGELRGQLEAAEAGRKRWLATTSKRPAVMAPQESKPTDLPVYRRGSVHHPAGIVPRGVLTVAFQVPVEPMPAEASGRRELANWLTRPEHPLTARVWVNRVWHWLFGAGLVRSVDNFGTTGDAPLDPTLLDYLTRRFVEEGWSTQWLIRELVQSRTYQQAGPTPERREADPENRSLGYFARRPLEAESLRDAWLALSGELNLTAPRGPTYDPKREADYGFTTSEPWRSVYLPAFRNALPELMTVFDQADPSRVVGARDRSLVAPQALLLLNHPWIRERAQHAAQRWATLDSPEAVRLDRAAQTILGRPLSAGERAVAERYLAGSEDSLAAWTDLIQAWFASVDFRFLE